LQKAATQKTKEIEKISNECDCEAVNTQCIWFAVPAEEEYDEDYIEEDKSKRRHR
jgi:hypothetical protein